METLHELHDRVPFRLFENAIEQNRSIGNNLSMNRFVTAMPILHRDLCFGRGKSL